MIALTFPDPDTGDDEAWNVSVKSHSPIFEKRKTATADAGDYLDPDVYYKGGYEVAQMVSNPLPATEIQTFYRFRKATEKGRPISVGASVVPLVGVNYVAIREGDLTPKSLHGGRFFTFTLNLRILSTD